ncbi:RNA polymerase subunit sigma-24 [Clostridium botulinum]|uniref:RNA polymerase subunit sigma-24 n=1 Tax=Clostridium botulinum TaxID=1491 RepID=UPI000947497E|nr:RNA polymerase subunit sigma-24 [Clostridium botulinum]APQ76382.1 rNA polymerase, sigma-24 subunit, ECF subfamily [Clostridium botulinum]MBN3354026.1 RNA polymerase subunit sigma-24 [Clostridium botulinum]QDY29426.1 RNA polymerase subunit sigma-24 [Clostridium botulinum]
MNKEKLKQLRYIKSEIESIKKQLSDLDYTVAADKVRGSSSHFPYVQRSFTITGVDYEEYNRKAKRLRRKLNKRIKELIDLVEKTNEFIEDIDDSLTRQIISLRYINGLTWEEVANSIGGNNTADSVRMLCNRFLDKI